MNAKQALAAVYQSVVGYDPFKDDPSIMPETVLFILQDYVAEGRDAPAGLRSAVWQLQRCDLHNDAELEGAALECIRAAMGA